LRNDTAAIISVTEDVRIDTDNIATTQDKNKNHNLEDDSIPRSTVESVVFSTTNLTINPLEVVANRSVAISTMVTNNSEEQGGYTVILKINGTVEDTMDIDLTGGVSQIVVFIVSKNIAGEYNVEIDGQIGKFKVLSAPAATKWPLIVGIVSGVVVIGIILLLLVKKGSF
jgi:hypothetical protein